MAENTAISWATHTFNPWIGCTKVSTGCANCYAETLMDTRWKRASWGRQGTRVRTSDANWRKPLGWDRKAREAGVRARVFCASLADVFEDSTSMPLDQHEIVQKARADLWTLIESTPSLDWLLLTKRPENVRYLVPSTWLDTYWFVDHSGHLRHHNGWPENAWLGTSIENQKVAAERLLHLISVNAQTRFVSAEPLLGPVQLGQPLRDGFIDWVIIGGESGPKARPMFVEWVHDLVVECEGRAAVHVKQTGDHLARKLGLSHSAGANQREWPIDLQELWPQEFPTPST